MFDKDNKFGFINNNENSNNNIEGLDKVKADINNVKNDLGNEELTTTNKDVKGAINELNTQYKDIAVKKIHQFDSVASMKSYNLSVGEVCCTLGYYTINDGGGALYYIKDTVTSNYGNIDIIILNNGNKAVLCSENNVNSIMFGDETTSSDDTSFLNNLFKYCSDFNIELKMIKGKTYNVSGELYFNSNLKIDFNDATIYLIDNSDKPIFLNLNAYDSQTEDNKIKNVVIKNVNVNGNSTNNKKSNLSGIFINAYNLANCEFKNIKLTNCYRNNFNLYYVENIDFKNISISNIGIETDGVDITGGNYGIELNYGKNVILENIEGKNLAGGTIHARYIDYLIIDNLYCYNNYGKDDNQKSIGLTITKCNNIKAKNISMDKIDRNGIELNEQSINAYFENITIKNTTTPIVIGCNSDDTIVNSNVYFSNIDISAANNKSYGITLNYVHGITFKDFKINCKVGANTFVQNILFQNGTITTGVSDNETNGGSLFGIESYEIDNVTINDIYYKHLIPNKITNFIFNGQISQNGSVNLDLNFLKKHTNTFGELVIKSYYKPSTDQFYIAKYLFGLSNNDNDSGTISNVIIEIGSTYRKITPSISNPGILTLSTTSDVDVQYVIELN